MSYYGQSGGDNRRYDNRSRFDQQYEYLMREMNRYRTWDEVVVQQQRPNSQYLDDMDRFIHWAVQELPSYYANLNLNKLVDVLTAVMEDRDLGRTGCALSVFFAGAYRLKLENGYSDRQAFEEGFMFFAAWFIVVSRWNMRDMSRDDIREMEDQAAHVSYLIGERRQSNNGGGRYSTGGNSNNGGFDPAMAQQRNRGYGEHIAAMRERDQPAYVPPANLVQQTQTHRTHQTQHNQQTSQPQPASQVPQGVPHMTFEPLSSTNWSNKKLPHPPFWYGNAVSANINSEGTITMTPASLALPAVTKSILRLGETPGFGEGPAYDVSALVAVAGFKDRIASAQPPRDMYTKPYDYITASYGKPGTLMVSLRASHTEIFGEYQTVKDALAQARAYFHKDGNTVVDMVQYLRQARLAGNAAIHLPHAYYWHINNVASETFRMMTEVMMGIDPYTLRLGCFAPTGKPEDDEDLVSFLSYLHDLVGKTYVDIITGEKFSKIFAELMFPTNSAMSAAASEANKELGEDNVLMINTIERYAYSNSVDLLSDLRCVKWAPVAGQDSPYGYAPSRIDRTITPALYEMMEGVLNTHPTATVPMATINFGYGKMLVTRSLIDGGIVAKWSSFVG